MASIDFSKSSHRAVPYILPLSLLVIKLFKIYCDRFTHLCRIYVHSDFIHSMSFFGLIFYLISCIHIWINYFHPINIFCNLPYLKVLNIDSWGKGSNSSIKTHSWCFLWMLFILLPITMILSTLHKRFLWVNKLMCGQPDIKRY